MRERRASVFALLLTASAATAGCSSSSDVIAELKRSNAALEQQVKALSIEAAEFRQQRGPDEGRKHIEARLAELEKRADDKLDSGTLSVKELVCHTVRIVNDKGETVGQFIVGPHGSALSAKYVFADDCVSVGDVQGKGAILKVNDHGADLTMRDAHGNTRVALATVAADGVENTALVLVDATGKGSHLSAEDHGDSSPAQLIAKKIQCDYLEIAGPDGKPAVIINANGACVGNKDGKACVIMPGAYSLLQNDVVIGDLSIQDNAAKLVLEAAKKVGSIILDAGRTVGHTTTDGQTVFPKRK